MRKIYNSTSYKLKGEDNMHSDKKEFFKLAANIFKTFEQRWNEDYNKLSKVNEHLKKALQGDYDAEQFFKDDIEAYLKERTLESIEYPSYYGNLVDAIYHENWGLAGIAEWFTEDYKESSSAKIIGERIYFLVNGEAKLMPQKITADRRAQLVAKLLSIKPDERKDKDVNEIYLNDGTRVTIFNSSISKDGQDMLVFRRYIVPEYTFEEQARRNTIPKEAIPFFKNMIELGYNIAITGAVRTAKSTFLATWQSYENPKLEGMLIETDPEIPLHKLMPDAPIMQIVADEDKLRNVIKHLLRSDSEYMIIGEARDGVALDAAIRIANKGTRRCKLTFHNRFPQDFPYDVSSEVVRTEGSDISLISEKVAQSIDYIFHFIQLKDKNQKRLDGIYELTCNRNTGDIIITQICKYNEKENSWAWNAHVSMEQEKEGSKENEDDFESFVKELRKLEKQFPMKEEDKKMAVCTRNYRKV